MTQFILIRFLHFRIFRRRVCFDHAKLSHHTVHDQILINLYFFFWLICYKSCNWDKKKNSKQFAPSWWTCGLKSSCAKFLRIPIFTEEKIKLTNKKNSHPNRMINIGAQQRVWRNICICKLINHTHCCWKSNHDGSNFTVLLLKISLFSCSIL